MYIRNNDIFNKFCICFSIFRRKMYESNFFIMFHIFLNKYKIKFCEKINKNCLYIKLIISLHFNRKLIFSFQHLSNKQYAIIKLFLFAYICIAICFITILYTCIFYENSRINRSKKHMNTLFYNLRTMIYKYFITFF